MMKWHQTTTGKLREDNTFDIKIDSEVIKPTPSARNLGFYMEPNSSQTMGPLITGALDPTQNKNKRSGMRSSHKIETKWVDNMNGQLVFNVT